MSSKGSVTAQYARYYTPPPADFDFFTFSSLSSVFDSSFPPNVNIAVLRSNRNHRVLRKKSFFEKKFSGVEMSLFASWRRRHCSNRGLENALSGKVEAQRTEGTRVRRERETRSNHVDFVLFVVRLKTILLLRPQCEATNNNSCITFGYLKIQKFYRSVF